MKLSPDRPPVLETRTYPSTTLLVSRFALLIWANHTLHEGEPLPDGGAAQLPADRRGDRDGGGVRAPRSRAVGAGRRGRDLEGHGRAAPAPADVSLVPRRAARRA